MAYRDDSSALQERFDSLSKQLEQVRAQAHALTAEEASLGRELDGVRARLDPAARRSLPLANVQIASPCSARWDEMKGDDRMRFCGDCKKHVHDLSKLTREEVDVFLHTHSEGACVRLYQRTDGTLITADCPVGLRRRRARALLVGTLSVGAAALFAFTALGSVLANRALDAGETPPRTVLVPLATATPRVPMVSTAVATPDTNAPPARPAELAMGFLWIDAPEGTRIYEGDRHLGNAPLQFAASSGPHALRAVHPKTKKKSTLIAVVVPRQIATARFEFDAPPRPSEATMGAMRIDHDPARLPNTL
jgi:hypothetical protein